MTHEEIKKMKVIITGTVENGKLAIQVDYKHSTSTFAVLIATEAIEEIKSDVLRKCKPGLLEQFPLKEKIPTEMLNDLLKELNEDALDKSLIELTNELITDHEQNNG